MLRAVLCATIVAGFPLTVGAAAAISEEIPIPGGTAAVAGAAGLREVPDRSRFVSEMTRLVSEAASRDRKNPGSPAGRVGTHLMLSAQLQRALAGLGPGPVSLADANDGDHRRRLTDLFQVIGLRLRSSRGAYTVESAGGDALGRARVLGTLGIDVASVAEALNRGRSVAIPLTSETVPVPLSAALWSDAILGRRVPPSELFGAIIGDDRATLLCHGLAGLDDETLEYVADRPQVLRTLYANAAVFAAFGSHLKIRGGRVASPGEALDQGARSIWEDLVEASTSQPERFIAGLFQRRAGRIAYLFDTIAELEPPRAAFALSLWMKDPTVRIAKARSLATAIAAAYPEWPTLERPFVRPLYDWGTVVNSISINADGSPGLPAAQRLWARAFDMQDLPQDPARELREDERDGVLDAAWLAQTVALADVRVRGRRVMQLAFGYRLFDGTSNPEDVLVAIGALPRYRMLLMSLERMGVRTPAVYAAAARRADALMRLDDRRGFVALSQFQGAVALLVRLASFASAPIEPLLTSLAAIPFSDGRPAGAIGEWVRSELLQGEGDTQAELLLLTALAGPDIETMARIDWEGGRYRFDPPDAELERLKQIRERQDGYSLDAAMGLLSAARSLGAASIDLDGIKRGIVALERLAAQLPPKAPPSPSDLVPGGAGSLPDPRAVVDEALRELGRVSRPQDVRRANEISDSLLEAADIVLAEVMSSLAYALSIGDPDGPTLLGGDVARRHDFGLASRAPGVRSERPWAVPEQHFDPGVPWHVSGSLLGLDLALAPLALKRLEGDGLLGPPSLGSNDRETFARSVALMNPYALTEAGRDTIGTSIARGRQRLAQARTTAELDSLADAVRMDGWRRRALHWNAAHEPTRMPSFFSVLEFLVLGGANVSELHAWGTAMTPIWGCMCLRMPAPNAWRSLTGRPQTGLFAISVPDVSLRVAAGLHELGLPAGLARSVLSVAMQQFVDTVRPNDGNDWLALVRGVDDLSRERMEDFVAAAAAAGGPLIPDTAAPRER
jgi:hypothetical protein